MRRNFVELVTDSNRCWKISPRWDLFLAVFNAILFSCAQSVGADSLALTAMSESGSFREVCDAGYLFNYDPMGNDISNRAADNHARKPLLHMFTPCYTPARVPGLAGSPYLRR